MEDMSVSTKDDKRREEQFPGVADIESGASPTDSGTAEIVTSAESNQRHRILHRVPQHVRERNKQIYEPLVISLGPYHHGQPHLRQYEHFKAKVVNIILKSEGSDKDKGSVFRSEVLKRVDEIRSFYGGLSRNEYDDEALVTMMLRDACLFLYFVEMIVVNEKIHNHCNQSIGLLEYSSMETDFYKLENQIPWWVIKSLISLTYDDDKAGALLCKFFSYLTCGDYNWFKQLPWKEGTEKEPLHFLEAVRVASLKEEKINGNTDHHRKGGQRTLSCPTFKFKWWRRRTRSSQRRMFELMKRPFRSATELRAKGIFLKPSSTFLDDIKFSSHPFYGVLHLPILLVDRQITTYFSNVIVLEMSPGSRGIPVTSYVNFMKSLIEKPEDAKLLQEKGTIISYLEDNEQIVKMINEIDTYGADDFYIFKDIRNRIDDHCNSYSKTWIAKLIHTYFRTPWTAVAFFAATILLCLTLLQTYYTMNPRS